MERELQDLKQNYQYIGPIYRNYPPVELPSERKKRKDQECIIMISVTCSISLILMIIVITMQFATNLARKGANSTSTYYPYKETINYNNGTNKTTFFVSLKFYPYIKQEQLSKYERDKIKYIIQKRPNFISYKEPLQIYGSTTQLKLTYFYVYLFYKLMF